MKKTRLVKTITMAAIVSMLVLGAFAISGCGTSGKSEDGFTGGVAASVNGENIEEDTITRYINNMRNSYGIDSEDGWKQYLVMYGTTPEAVRYNVLGQYVEAEIVRQCADKLDISVSEEEVDGYVEDMSSKYEDQEAWEEALDKAGYKDGIEGYRKQLKDSIIGNKVMDFYKEKAQSDFGKKDLLAAVKDSIGDYDGAKRVSQIVFSSDNEALANKVLKQLRNGQITFKDAVEKYSTDEGSKAKGGDIGWDSLSELSDSYTTALEKMKKGKLSEVVATDDGYAILQVTDTYAAPKKVSSTKDVPSEFVTAIKEETISNNANDNFESWVDEMKSQQEIVINPMPENVPYNIDISEDLSQEQIDEINKKAYDELVGNTEEEAVEASEAENEAAEGEDTEDKSDAQGENAEANAGEEASEKNAEESSASESN